MARQQFTFQRIIPIEFGGKFPPDARALSGLGFDSVSVSGSEIAIRRSRRGLHNLPVSTLEIRLRKNAATLRISAPASCDPRLQELCAATGFLRVLSLFPSVKISSQELSALLLPSLDEACRVAATPYESLSKKLSDAQNDLVLLLSKNKSLLRSSEEDVLSSLELRRQSEALSARIAKLEAISDEALLELVCDWIFSHRGSFNAALFAKAHSVPAARAEEGLGRLLASGEIRKVGGSLHAHSPHSHGTFEHRPRGILSSLKGALKPGRKQQHI
jgi:hypothetical protein